MDFAAAPVTVSEIRKSVVDFTIAFQDVSLTALVRSGSQLHNLDDLLASNLTYGTIRSGSTANALMGSRDPAINTLWSRIVSHNGMVDAAQQGREKAKKGDYAFIMETPIADYFVSQDCSLETAGSFYPQAGFAFPAQKYYQDLPKFNQAIVEIKRDGKIQTLIDKWWAPQTCAAPYTIVASSALFFAAVFFSVLV